jgi:AcrR family transcriptional regulator
MDNLARVSARETAELDSWLGELGPLPGGHHGLSRAQIMESQRERLLAAISRQVASRGYQATTITEVVKLASVSTRDFYDHFEGVEDCFLAAFDAVRDYLDQLLIEAAARGRYWPDQLIAALRTALDFFATEPDLARLCLVDPLRSTPTIALRFREATLTCIPALARGRDYLPHGASLPASTEESLIGGALSLLTSSILAGESHRLPTLLPDLIDFILSPYLGAERAAELARESRFLPPERGSLPGSSL